LTQNVTTILIVNADQIHGYLRLVDD